MCNKRCGKPNVMGLANVALALSVALISAADVMPVNDPVLEEQFKCPEEALNVDGYIHELAQWLHLVKVRHPDWNNEETAEYRHDLFVKHHCTGRVSKE